MPGGSPLCQSFQSAAEGVALFGTAAAAAAAGGCLEVREEKEMQGEMEVQTLPSLARLDKSHAADICH